MKLPRSSRYYASRGESEENLALIGRLDELEVSRKRAQRLMWLMGIEAIYPKRQPSQPAARHKIYPCLLCGGQVERPNKVWSSDITYVPLRQGWAYLAAAMDLFSRKVLSWKPSNMMEAAFGREALAGAVRPEVFNTDQGSQYTSSTFTGRLEEPSVAINMDGRGRSLDNVFIKRLWRSVKYEDVYLRDYQNMRECEAGLVAYFAFYNARRRRQWLGRRTTTEVYADAA